MGEAAWWGAITVAVGALLAVERRGSRWLRAAVKSVASGIFVGAGLSGLSGSGAYGTWIVTGLALSFLGDQLLAVCGTLRPGLVAFSLAHLAYIIAFKTLLPVTAWQPWLGLAVAAIAVLVLRLLGPYLGTMAIPVVGYVIVASLMVWGAGSATVVAGASTRVAAGALLFYLSDLAVARDRFVKRGWVNRVVGLPVYYSGQMLLALSIRV